MHAWVAACTDALYTEGAVAILHALDALSPNTQEARDVVRQMRAYVESNAARMDYPAFVAAAWPIGSDMIETQCTTLVQARLKGAGMRWTDEGAQTLATLRTVQASGQWPAFRAAHPPQARLHRSPLCPSPASPSRGTPHRAAPACSNRGTCLCPAHGTSP